MALLNAFDLSLVQSFILQLLLHLRRCILDWTRFLKRWPMPNSYTLDYPFAYFGDLMLAASANQIQREIRIHHLADQL